VSIVRTLERVSGGWRFAETKRARSRRVIKLQGWMLGEPLGHASAAFTLDVYFTRVATYASRGS
jgi:hypothetical protein